QVTGKELPVRSMSRRGRVRPQRDFAAMEQRRMRAVDLFEQGVIPAEIARQVGVSHQIVSDWRAAWRQSGREALRAAGRAGRRPNALIVFEDESGVSLLPSVRATWAPRGHTPVLNHRFNWKRVSLAGALAYEPDGSDAHLVFQLRPGAYNDETLIEFLAELHQLDQ